MMRTGARAILLTTLLLIINSPLYDDPPIGSASGSGDPVITIKGDDELTTENGVSSGSGTEGDPYIIENKNITTDQIGTINIRDTESFLTIRNCSLYCNRDNPNPVLNISSSSNITIYDCRIENYRMGVFVSDSNDIIISNSVFPNGLISIYTYKSSDISIDSISDILYKNDQSISIDSCQNVTIKKCNLTAGIWLFDSCSISVSDTEMRFGITFDENVFDIDFATNNTVGGKELLFLKDRDEFSFINAITAGEIILINVSNIQMYNLLININTYLISCNNIRINNTMLETHMDLRNCSNVSIGNVQIYCSILYFTDVSDLDIFNSSVTQSVVRLCDSNNVTMTCNKHIMDSQYFFESCDDIVYSNNNHTDCASALGWVTELIFWKCRNILLNNDSFDRKRNIGITDSEDVRITGCDLWETRIGIVKCINTTIDSNVCGHYSDFQFQWTNDTYVHTNIFPSKHNEFISYGSQNVFVYNNIFNYVPTCDQDPINWSYLIKGVKNIMGGPNIGGNYWVGYDGRDTNFDGFGDEYLPQGPGDNYPLIDLRGNLSLQDLTNGVPVTGRDYSIKFKAWEPIETMSDLYYRIDYSFYNYYGVEFDVRSTAGYLSKSNDRSYDIRIKDEAVRLDYIITVSDRYGRATSVNGSIPVMDGIPPRITVSNMSSLKTSEEAFIRFSITDNIGIDSFNATMLVNDDKNITELEIMTEENGYYLAEFSVDPTTYRLRFILNTTDVNGFEAMAEFGWYPVYDIIAPSAHFQSDPTAKRGENYTIRFTAYDNIRLSYIALYQIIGDQNLLVPWHMDRFGYYSTVKIYEFQPTSAFLLFLKDEEGNKVEKELELTLGPMDLPFTVDPGRPMTGEIGTVAIDLDPYIDVDSMKCRFNEGKPINLTYDPEIRIPVPIEARTMTLGIDLRDGGGYKYHYQTTCDVLDVIPPSITVDASNPVCGERFSFRPMYTDNIAVSSHGIVYDHGRGPIEKDDDENFLTAIDIPIYAYFLNISIWAKDLQGNIAYRNLTLDVIDGIFPVINSIDAEIVYDRIRIIASISDNRGSDNLECRVESDSMSSSQSMDLVDGSFEAWIDPPEGIDQLYFTVIAIDGHGNFVRSEVRGIEIPLKEVEDPPDREEGIPSIIKIALIALVVLVLGSIFFFLIRRSKRSPEE